MIIFLVIMIILMLLMILVTVRFYYMNKEHGNPILKGEKLKDKTRMIEFNELQGRKPLQQFLIDYPEFEKQTLEAELAVISENLILLTEDKRISSVMIHMMSQSTKRQKLLNMTCQRTNLLSYKDNMIYAIAVYADQREEYVVSMRLKMEDGHLFLFAFDITLGSKTNLVTK